MSRETKLFGMRIPLDSKVLVGLLLVIALVLVWYNFSGGDDRPANGGHGPALGKTASPALAVNRNAARRALPNRGGKQGPLRVKAVDPTRGDIDPTLKLYLLDRVRAVKPLQNARNLFDTGVDVAAVKLPPMPKVPKIIPRPLPGPGTISAGPPPQPAVNIPLRYYGFVRPGLRADGNRGYFMDGDNILMATEGDLLESRFLVVALSPNTARVEDIQLKQGQDLPLIPEAISQ